MLRRLAVLALALCSTSCDPAYRFEREEILLRYQAKEDALLVLEVEHGIRGEPGKTVEALAAALRGRRRYPAEGGFIDVDFDKTDETVAPGKEAQRADFLEFGKLLKVDDVRVFDDEQGRLSFLRLSRIEKFRHALELVNRDRNRDL